MALFESLGLPDILKASAAQALALAVACGAILYLSSVGLLPPLEQWLVLAAAFVGIFAGALFIALLARNALTALKIGSRVRRRRQRNQFRGEVADYIPHMTKEERSIVGYLLEHNQKSFDRAADGGYARNLLARGIIENALIPGQLYDPDHVPMRVPDDAWTVLLEHRTAFPARYKGDSDPWRVHWMAI